MKKSEKLARLLLARMKEIDPSKGDINGLPDESPTSEHYALLWDAILDEIIAVCPTVYAEIENVHVWN